MNQGGTARWIENLVVGLREETHEVILLAGFTSVDEIEDESFNKLNGVRVENLGRSIKFIDDIKSTLEIKTEPAPVPHPHEKTTIDMHSLQKQLNTFK